MKERIRITKASIENLTNYQSEILELMKESWRMNFPNSEINKKKIIKRFENMLNYVENDEGLVLIALSKDNFLGYLWYFITDNNRIHINQIITANKFRREGIGTELINVLYTEAKKMEISEIELNVTASNEQAMNFYKKENFKAERILLKRDINV